MRCRTDLPTLVEYRLTPESRLLNERCSPPERMFGRIQHWSAGAHCAGGPFFVGAPERNSPRFPYSSEDLRRSVA